MLYAILIISIASLLLSLVVLFLVLRKEKEAKVPSVDPQAIEELKKNIQDVRDALIKSETATSLKIATLQEGFNTSLENRLASFNDAQKLSLSDSFGKQKDANAQVLNSFQESINNRLDSMNKALKEQSESDTKRINDFQNGMEIQLKTSIDAINKRIDEKMAAINEKVGSGLEAGFQNTSETMANLKKELGALEAAQKNVQDLQNQITNLNGILSSNQERGKYGEWQLELILQSMFEGGKGTLYDTQFILQKGADEEHTLKPDAVIFLDGAEKKQIICIDSKFSLTGYEELFDRSKTLSPEEEKKANEEFKAALKKRIDETAKYVIKGKTVANAIMFIPSDGIFAYIQQQFPEIREYADKKRVVIASPTILQPLIASFRVIQVDYERRSKVDKISEAIDGLAKEFDRFIPRWETLNKQIGRLTSSSDQFNKTVNKIDNKFRLISGARPEEIGTGDGAIEESDAPKEIEQSDDADVIDE